MADTTPAKKTQSYATKGEYVRQLRERKGLSQAQAADLWDVAERTLRDVEKGRGASVAILIVVASKLGLSSWHELLTDAERAALGPDPSGEVPSPPPPAPPPTIPTPTLTNRLFQLPAPLADFVGRKEQFDAIVARLSGTGGKVGLSALRGMGGVGKTSLAVLVANEVKDKFPDAQLFLELRGVSDTPMTTVEAMSHVIRSFHPDERLPDAIGDLEARYRSVLSGKRALIVLDNAKDEAQVKPLLSAGPPVAFLITSRNALKDLAGVEKIRLDVLPPAEALQLLREIVGTKGTDDELRAVAELCGCLPLALRVAGNYLAAFEDCTVGEYISDLKAFGLEQLQKEVIDDDQKVELVLSHSAKVLVLDNPERAERWQALSVFPSDFDIAAAGAVWGLSVLAATDELRALSARSLVEYDWPTARYSLHDLMRHVARNALNYVFEHPHGVGTPNKLHIAERHYAMHYLTVLATADDLYQRGGNNVLVGLGRFDRDAKNIRRGWRWAADHRNSERLAVELCRDYPNLGAYVLEIRLSARERVVWLHASIEACRQLGDRQSEGGALGNLGLAYAELGDPLRAIALHEEYLAIARELGNRHAEGNALANLGIAHRHLGDARTAINVHEQALAVLRDLGDRRGECVILGNLGSAHAVLGDLPTAIAFHELHLVVARAIGDRRGEGIALGNLGVAHKNLGDTLAAISFYEQHLAIASVIGDRRGEGTASWNMALALDHLGQRDSAIQHATRALTIYETIEHPSSEKIRQKLAEWRGEA